MRPGSSLHHVELGPRGAPAILFLHGITGSRRYWLARVRPLQVRYRLVLPDLVGFGLSPKPEIDYTIDVFRDSVRCLVEELGLQRRPMAIVGHSLGSLIALEYAARHPGHADRLILFNLPRYADSLTAHALFWRGSPHYRRLLNEHSLRETLSQMKRTGLEVTLRYLFRLPWSVIVDSRKFTFRSLTSTLENCLLNYQVDRILPSVPPIPTLLIHGEKDSVAPFEAVRDLPNLYPHMTLSSVRGTGHHLFLTHTRHCLDLIERFLSLPSRNRTAQSTDLARAGGSEFDG